MAEGMGSEWVRHTQSLKSVYAKSTQRMASATTSPAKQELLGSVSPNCVSQQMGEVDLAISLELSQEADGSFLAFY